MKHFSSFLPSKGEGLGDKPAIWSNITARVGSISDNRMGGWYSYRSTKAGLNQATKTFDIELSRRSGDAAMAVALHPGTVKV
jgi:NAD(P)-dependent dehydrogenase (short-subunit alcohol dehydrogenase family)